MLGRDRTSHDVLDKDTIESVVVKGGLIKMGVVEEPLWESLNRPYKKRTEKRNK